MNRVLELYARYGFRASPVLDQYFLNEAGALHRLVRYASLSKGDTVLEIGPGLGFITEILAKEAGSVIAVEKDKRLEPLLREELRSFPNVQLIFSDILEAQLPKFNKVVSNIPYSLSAPITFRLLDHEFDCAVLIYQKEFAKKMVAQPGTPDYGRLSVMVGYYFDAKVMEFIPRGSFYPQPNVDAGVVRLARKPITREKRFDDFVRELFRYPNKDVHNAMKIAFGIDIADARKVDHLTIPEVRQLYDANKQ